MRLRAWKEGVRSGVLDWCCPLPSADNSALGLFIEFKIGKNTLSPEQQKFAETVAAAGWNVAVCYDWQSAWKALLLHLGVEVEGGPL